MVLAPIFGVYLSKNGFEHYFYFAIVIISAIFACICFYLWASEKISNSEEFSLKSFALFKDKTFNTLLSCAFFSFAIMGIFITSTIFSPRINVDFTDYVGIFFATVGVVICIWQLILSKLFVISDTKKYLFLFLLSIISSLFFVKGVTLALIALISYGIFEAIIVPEIFISVAKNYTKQNTALAFSLILVMANIGDAFGTFLSGVAIDYFDKYVALAFSALIFVFSIFSLFLLVISRSKDNIIHTNE